VVVTPRGLALSLACVGVVAVHPVANGRGLRTRLCQLDTRVTAVSWRFIPLSNQEVSHAHTPR
jgi:hypothetical protein